jgi:glycerol uptake facilitator-like aquaporin
MVHPGIGAPMPAFLADWGRNIVTESTVTFFLMLVIMAVATVRGGELTTAALGVGFAVVVGVLAAAPISGAAMNPARAFGPALLTGGNALVALPLYFVGPILGAVLAARVYEWLRLHPEDGQSAPRESGEGSV